ncbi:MAG: GGDEF domain-containing protein [Selenomonas sp.]|uniref:GGDEF domain-containing protein n=1 Tax=Selenomonas sp. TaxID=2053611 RepID=UPI0025FD4A5F|nr:GGDEF domain-containing protein [Selenomonas sp.]MCR5758677.1 GGDEF domain-containing protein [Selenomonas sp.]
MAKILYRILLCLGICLGLMGYGCSQAAELEGPWHYYEFSGDPLPEAPEFARQHIAEWPVFDMESRPHFAADTNRLLLAVKVNDAEPQKKILLFMTAKQAVRMWLGDEFFFSAGSFLPQRFDEGSQPYMLSLPDFSGQRLLVVELYAHAPQDLGWFSMFSVDTEQVQLGRLFFSDIPLILAIPVGIAILFIMGLYYFFNAEGWRRLYSYIGLFMVVFLLWIISAASVKSLFFDCPVFWWYSLSILAYLLPITSNLVLAELLKGKQYAHMEYVLGAYVFLFGAAMIGEGLGWHTMNGLMSWFYLLLPLGEGAAIYWCILAAREGDALCRAVLLPTLTFTLLGIVDGIAGHYHLLPWHMYVTPFGIYAFLYFVICILREEVRYEDSLLEQTAGLEKEVAALLRKAETDALTGCWNRNKLRKLLAKAIANAGGAGQTFALLMLDIDYFKRINDNYGHDMGDAVLRAFATAVRYRAGRNNPCIRWGGEEFLILTAGDNLEEVKELAEEIRQHIASIPLAGQKITCSIGIALWRMEKDTTAALFKRVDDALYRAKNNGRNCVVVGE